MTCTRYNVLYKQMSPLSGTLSNLLNQCQESDGDGLLRFSSGLLEY